MIARMPDGRLRCSAHPRWRGTSDEAAWSHLEAKHGLLVAALSRATLEPVVDQETLPFQLGEQAPRPPRTK